MRPQLARWRIQLLDRIAGGTMIVLLTVAAGNAIRLLGNILLTRVLDSSAFGVIGVLASISFIIAMMSDVGTLPFVVRDARGADRQFLDEVWTLRLIRAAALTGVIAALANPIAGFAGKPELGPALSAWSVIFLLEGLGSMSFATALREQQLKRLGIVELVSAVLQIVASITLAFLLRNYWALVGGGIIGAVIKLVLSYALFPGSGRRFLFSRARAAEMWGFARYILGSSMLTIIIMQADKVVFARIMTLAQFGLYNIATTLALAPLSAASPYASRILYPAYAHAMREQPYSALRDVYYRHKRLFSVLYMFAVGGFVGCAPLVVELLYDPRYRDLTPLLQWLALGPLFLLSNLAADNMLIATGRPWNTLLSSASRASWLLVGGFIGYMRGDMMLLVATVGTIELLPTLLHWALLRHFHLFSLRREMELLAVSGLGVGIGWAVTQAVHALF